MLITELIFYLFCLLYLLYLFASLCQYLLRAEVYFRSKH